tara:strand:- start:2834 stop:3973 length:1140 start_codon:yes stop_codon:yes gene_type:complete
MENLNPPKPHLGINNIELNSDEMKRYARHISLPEIGISGQKLLKNSSIICIGSGGLGSPLLLYLAAAGVGNIGIVDNDYVEMSNLQRQIIHDIDWLHKPKIESAKNRILKLNPNCKVHIFREKLSIDNALETINPFDIVCDCTDNFPSRYLISDACVLLNKPHIYGSVAGFEGQVSVFNSKEPSSPTYRDLIPIPPPPGILPSCEEGGVMGVMPGMIGLIQASETIKVITGVGEILSGKILAINLLSARFTILNLKANPKNKEISHETFYKKNLKDKIDSISSNDLLKILTNESENVALIDVRTKDEHKKKSIEKSILIPLELIENGEGIDLIRKIDRKKKLYFYCKTGTRSNYALSILKKEGIYGVNLNGGIDSWRFK